MLCSSSSAQCSEWTMCSITTHSVTNLFSLLHLQEQGDEEGRRRGRRRRGNRTTNGTLLVATVVCPVAVNIIFAYLSKKWVSQLLYYVLPAYTVKPGSQYWHWHYCCVSSIGWCWNRTDFNSSVQPIRLLSFWTMWIVFDQREKEVFKVTVNQVVN